MTATSMLPPSTAAPQRLWFAKLNKIKINVYLDVLLTIIFIVEMEEHFTGLPIHEWLGVFFAGAFLVHILLHWDWVVNLTRKFFQNWLHETRLNYILNALLLGALFIVTITGILMSRTLGLSITLATELEAPIHMLHLVGSELVLILVALHVAMHWKWIQTNAAKYLLGWLPRLSK